MKKKIMKINKYKWIVFLEGIKITDKSCSSRFQLLRLHLSFVRELQNVETNFSD